MSENPPKTPIGKEKCFLAPIQASGLPLSFQSVLC